MGVLSLQAAIEAGRLGEDRKTVCGDSRRYPDLCWQIMIRLLHRQDYQLEQSDERFRVELGNQVHHLITLLKENNIANSQTYGAFFVRMP